MGLEDKFENFGGGDFDDSYVPFFHLANDKDTAIVRFLHGDENDVDETGTKVVHPEVEIEGKTRKVACLKSSDCPLCKAGFKQSSKFYLQLLDYTDTNDDGSPQHKVWERGRSILPDVLEILDRFGTMFRYRTEIVRHGEKGSTNTQYRFYVQSDEEDYEREHNEENMEVISETRSNLFGPEKYNLVIVRSKEDLEEMANGTFTFDVGEENKSNSESKDKNDVNSHSKPDPKKFF